MIESVFRNIEKPNRKMHKIFNASIPYVIGILLFISATLKAYELSTVPVTVNGNFSSRVFSTGVVLIELAFSLVLLNGFWIQQVWKATITLFILFAGFSLYKALAGFESCGCFGRVQLNPWWTFLMDILVLVMLSRSKPEANVVTLFDRLRLRTALLFFVFAGGAVGFFNLTYEPTVLNNNGTIIGESNFVVLEPEAWIGQPLPIGSMINVFDQMKHNECILLLYHYDCSKCREVLPRYEQLAANQLSDDSTIALVEVPPYSSKLHSSTDKLLHGKLADTKDWFVSTPIEIRLENGVVTQVSRKLKSLGSASEFAP